MVDKWQIDKNIKDLEYHQILNKITTAVIILATLIITGVFSNLWSVESKIIVLGAVSIVALFQIKNWYFQLQDKIQDIKMLK